MFTNLGGESQVKDSLKTGLATTRRFMVDRDRTIGFMGEDARVYSTPSLVHDIEVTCMEFLAGHLDEGEASVGARVELDHLAPTLLGMWVDITATVLAHKGRAVTFEVTALDAVDEVARCAHNRFVVDFGRTKERLAAKAAKAKEA
jgi:predicted thioesterase